MTGISIGHMVHTERPLIWRSEPCCPRCTLPFTSATSDEPVQRVPLLLECQHLLCGQCVQECAVKNRINCEICRERTVLPENPENATAALHVSLFVLGLLQQSQCEKASVDAYWKKDGASKTDRVKGAPAGKLSSSDLSTPQKLLSLLEKSYHSYEKSKKHLEQRAKTQQENVSSVVEQINAHFVDLHNALQAEETRLLQKVRQAYIERSRQNKADESQLKLVRERFQDLIKRAKDSSAGPERVSSSAQVSKSLSTEVRRFLENEPLKLKGDLQKSKLRPPFRYEVRDHFAKSIQSCYKLSIESAQSDGMLVPVTYENATKHPASGREERKSSDRSKGGSTEKLPSLKKSGPVSTGHEDTEDDRLLKPKHGEEKQTLDYSKLLSSSKLESMSSKKTDNSNHSERSKDPNGRKSSAVAKAVDPPSTKSRHRASSERKHSSREKPHNARFTPKWRTVHVTCVVSPHEFYAQDELFTAEGSATLGELCNNEAEAYECELSTGCSPMTVTPGSLYLVRPSVYTSQVWHKNWQRAEVLAVDTPLRGQYRVQYVDYGQLDTVGREQIRPISGELGNASCEAIKCTLYGVEPPQQQPHWTAECRQMMMDFIDNQPIMLCELDARRDKTLVVDLFLAFAGPTEDHRPEGEKEDSQWKGYYAPMSLRDALIYLEQAESSVAEVDERGDRRENLQRWLREVTHRVRQQHGVPAAPILPEHDHFRCLITDVRSPDHFYLVPVEWRATVFESLTRQLNAVCMDASTRQVYSPYVGLVCAFASTDKEGTVVWLRGRVDKIRRGRCELFALDTGEVREAPWSDMCLLPPGHPALARHPLAVSCRLAHIRPKRVAVQAPDRWTREATEEFRQIACSGTLRFAVTMGRYRAGIYDVVLYLHNKSDRDTCLNGLLVRNGHADCTGPDATIGDRLREPPPVQPQQMEQQKAPEGEQPGGSPGAGQQRVADPRLPVEMLRVVSPGEFYVRLRSRKDALEQLHQILQEQMDEQIDEAEDADGPEGGRSPGDVCVVFAKCTPDAVASCEWHRARIVSVREDGLHYEAFLLDRAVTVQVHRANVARLTARMGQVQPGAIRCKLACMSPIGGSTIWHRSSLDAFRDQIAAYPQHAISLDTKPAPAPDAIRALSVVLWGVRIEDRNALAPRRTVYSNLNQSMAKVGLAHLSGRFRTFATSGSGATEEQQLLEDAIEAQVRAENEQMQQFFRTVAAVQRGATDAAGDTTAGRGAVRDGSKTAQNVLSVGAMGEWMEASCHAALELVGAGTDDQPGRERVQRWLPVVPLEKTIFVGTPTAVAPDGTVYLHDVCQEPVLDRIRTVIQAHLGETGAGKGDDHDSVSFAPGMPCLARFHLDAQYYRASVLHALKGDRFRVLFVDYGNVEECALADLRPATVCGCVPVQATPMRLSGIGPKWFEGGKKRASGPQQWPEAVLDAYHAAIVQKRCSVRVDPDEGPSSGSFSSLGSASTVPHCTLRLLDVTDSGAVDVVDVLLALGLFVRTAERRRGRGGSKDRPVASGASMPYYSSPPAPLIAEERQIELDLRPVSPPSAHGQFHPVTPEQRDLMRWMEEIQTQYQANCAADSQEQEDPNEWNYDDSFNPLNRAQLIDGFPAADWDEPVGGPRSAASVGLDDASPLPSPATMHSDEFETSSRLSGEGGWADPAAADQNQDVLFRSFPFLPPIDRAGRGFFGEFTNYGQSLTVYVYPHLEGHTRRMATIAERVQARALSTNSLHRWQASVLEAGSPCLAPYSADGLYYRAIVEQLDEAGKRATVLFVDYLNRETVPLAVLRKCAIELQRAPLRNVPVRVTGVRMNPRLREEDVVQQFVGVLTKSFYVRLAPGAGRGDCGVPLVELYTDATCQTLVYESMIAENFFIRTHAPKEL